MLSRDVSGHFADDGKTVMKPLEGQTAEQIYRAHHNLHPVTGKLLPGFTTHQGRGCECDHCQEYVLRGNRPSSLDQSKVDDAKRRLGL